ncbi:response regulator [Streptomyces phytohabitans]|uniref:response regulator n=1 Tax=Streptomyces phytohabitans TaxID=1150371 RepID=UPI00345BDA5C
MDSTRAPIRVALVDDEHLTRMALRLVVDAEPDLTVVAEAADGDAALAVVDEHRPDVVLMDIRMPGRDGVSATRAVLARPEPPRVLVLTALDSDDLVLGALGAGALGFLYKDTQPREILRAVRTVAAGNPSLSPGATARLISVATGPRSAPFHGASHEEARTRFATLTERERDTARGIAAGLSNTEIAERLHVSVATVKARTGGVLAKLDVRNRVQIALAVHHAESRPGGPDAAAGRGGHADVP